MKTEIMLSEEATLDPQDWTSIRTLGHQMLDDMLDYLQSAGQLPAWKKPSAYAVGSMNQPLPEQSQEAASVYEDFFNQVLPFNNNNVHPRFWAWVQGGGTPMGMLADMLASGMNSNVSLGDHMAMYVEKQVIGWAKEMMGFPSEASGILLSGGSLANITALVVARNHFNKTIRAKGLQSVQSQLIVYGSSETHNCAIKGIEVIGIGNDNFRRIPIDENYRIKTDELKAAIEADIAAGLTPFCIIGNAGTVNTGAIDPLTELSAIAKAYGCWFHIDGAFGAIPKILPEFQQQLAGIELADSLAFDYHKWLYVNYEVACVLIRDADAHRNAFTVQANYLVTHERGLSAGPEAFSNLGMELSRGFKALKVWMSLKENGMQKYRQLVRQNIRQAEYLANLIRLEDNLQLMAEVSLNIVCFRYATSQHTDDELNHINKEILMRLHEEGIALPSYTLLNGKYVIRAAITNHRSRLADFDALVNAVVSIGNDVAPTIKIND
ncbi:amino acid decarboxylase [Pseudoflavitalea sp. G-6-1-2]|uniref:pyridoxal phosphate-dependent decarboxylase family protein n=1 Tax=Pseudoflavitalea sp. G-6-1-2 TaxID=2728841 RepID=UPI00146DABF1|nr:pyridoxal-dependent decarboxylase [Pseudoflavitalea sp. G-6-1-2]NML20313.1 amino acid decarboxylase [Pseudoflavitalea sp. G-6-1-2]